MNNQIAELKRVTEVLLKKDDDFGEITPAIDDLNNLFLSATELDVDGKIEREDVYLASGKAIGPVWAAMCVKEYLRTKRFISGVYNGIKAAQQRFPEKTIHVLYAGTGPFATLAIPLTTMFSSSEVKFTMLEINPTSIEYLKKVINAFDAQGYINEIIECDATKFKAKAGNPIHMIVSETMQNALKKEPQVGITLNLLPQMEKGGILIPENIKIEAGVLNSGKNIDRMMGEKVDINECYKMIDTIFELNKNSSKEFKEVTVDVIDDFLENYHELSLFTTIQVFGDDILTHWQCSLNVPLRIVNFDRVEQPFNKVSFRYVMTDVPGFKFELN